MKGARVLTWLQDLYPEVAREFGVIPLAGLVEPALRRLRNRSLRKAWRNVAIGERMAERLRQQDLPGPQVVVLHNMTDEQAIRPLDPGDNPLRAEWGYRPGDLVVGYSGNLGRAHDLETLLGAAEALQRDGRADVRFLMIGGGHLFERLREERDRRGLRSIELQPYQPRDRLPLSLTVPDVHWLSLAPALEGLIVPSKFYGAAASGRPLIFIGDADGEVARMIAAAGCGRTVAPGDSEGFAAAIVELREQEVRHAQGAAARRLVETEYARARTLSQWSQLLDAN
jgi:glycosyltransferase involved in cell wall biosynthesis